MFDVESEAFLRSVAPHEVRRQPTDSFVIGAREITYAGSFDLDDARAEISQLTGSKWSGNSVLQGNDCKSIQGKRGRQETIFSHGRAAS